MVTIFFLKNWILLYFNSFKGIQACKEFLNHRVWLTHCQLGSYSTVVSYIDHFICASGALPGVPVYQYLTADRCYILLTQAWPPPPITERFSQAYLYTVKASIYTDRKLSAWIMGWFMREGFHKCLANSL